MKRMTAGILAGGVMMLETACGNTSQMAPAPTLAVDQQFKEGYLGCTIDTPVLGPVDMAKGIGSVTFKLDSAVNEQYRRNTTFEPDLHAEDLSGNQVDTVKWKGSNAPDVPAKTVKQTFDIAKIKQNGDVLKTNIFLATSDVDLVKSTKAAQLALHYCGTTEIYLAPGDIPKVNQPYVDDTQKTVHVVNYPQ